MNDIWKNISVDLLRRVEEVEIIIADNVFKSSCVGYHIEPQNSFIELEELKIPYEYDKIINKNKCSYPTILHSGKTKIIGTSRWCESCYVPYNSGENYVEIYVKFTPTHIEKIKKS